MVKKIGFLFILVIVLLVACNAQEQVTKPVPSIIPVSITATAFINTTVTSSVSTLPVNTLTPTSTPGILTQQEISKAIVDADYEKLCGGSAEPAFYESPNHVWGIVYCFTFTKIFRLDGTQEWVVSAKNLELPNENLRTDFLYLVNWSSNGQFVYLRLFECCIDGGQGGISVHDQALYRLSLSTGEMSALLSPIADFYSFEISPNTQLLSYVNPEQEDRVFLKNIETGDEISVKLDKTYEAVGSFVWAQDDSGIYFVGQIGDRNDGLSGFSLLFLDVKENSISILFDNDPRLFTPEKWLETNVLLLLSNKPDTDVHYWAYNLKTKQIVPTQEP